MLHEWAILRDSDTPRTSADVRRSPKGRFALVGLCLPKVTVTDTRLARPGRMDCRRGPQVAGIIEEVNLSRTLTLSGAESCQRRDFRRGCGTSPIYAGMSRTTSVNLPELIS